MRRLILPILLLIIILLISFFFIQKTNNTSYTKLTPTVTPITGKNALSFKKFTDLSQKVSFDYPEKLAVVYITPVTWPPKIMISSSPFSCETGISQGEQIRTIKKTIGAMTYCIQVMSQGAAGTIYSNYTYVFVKGGKLITLQFSIGYPQCDNFEQPAQSQCRTERQTFDLDSIVNRIAQSIRLL